MSRLVIFLSLYFCIYGSAHLYLLMKARRAFYLNGVHYALLFVVFTFLLLAPINARLLELGGHSLSAVMLAWIGFIWMGFVFIFVCLALPVDGYHLLVGAGQHLLGTDWTDVMLSKRQSIGLITLITAALMIYGAFEAYHIRTEHITLRSDKIPPHIRRIRVVQISDVHLGTMFYPGRLDAIVSAIEKAEPDLLISTGDLIDGQLFNPSTIINAFQGISAPLGKFAVTGNHEFYVGVQHAAAITQSAGFTLLRNASQDLNEVVVVTGVDDPAGDAKIDIRETELLEKVPDNKFSLLLKHRPAVEPRNIGKFDLQLSGHTHQGQIFPFEWIVSLTYSLGHGMHPVAPNQYIYISRGTGTWGPPIRLLAPPEITVIDVMPKINEDKGEENKKAAPALTP